ncbi:hypothetical protein LC613_30300 [Nostoc sphaeroides CHAB 2801]|uniref:hypothetical protein n=1 Tax=Nostoc sphaeroides TaxID=446679 RepID=UPI001E4F1A73|nr:hypothetical protein [Nostoc sphaeroides]MCC5631980.1 hypothetical protein [Nostoc sphaeroides CHAB 2801]
MEARKSLNSERERQLRKVIDISLVANANTAIKRAEYELLEVASNYLVVIASYAAMQEKLQDLDSRMTSTIKAVSEQIAESFSREITRFSERCVSIRESCFREMNGCTTDSAERFWKGENFQWKKEKLRKCRDQHQEQIVSEFSNFSSNLCGNISIIAKNCQSLQKSLNPPQHNNALERTVERYWR